MTVAKSPIPFPRDRTARQPTIELAEVESARARIAPHVRRTPTMQAWLDTALSRQTRIYLKLENLQVAGGLETRGVLYRALTLAGANSETGLVTVSAGNIGAAVAYAARLLDMPATVFVPRPFTSRERMEDLAAWNARVVVQGTSWDAADRAAQAFAVEHGMTYVHPVADPALIVGHATVGLEVVQSIPDLATLVVSGLGGGNALAGIAAATKALRPDVRVIGVELESAPRLQRSRKEGRMLDLPAASGVTGPRRASPLTFELVRRYVDDLVLVSQDECQEALRRLWHELEVSSGLGGAVAVAAVLTGRVAPPSGALCAVVGASGEEGLFR